MADPNLNREIERQWELYQKQREKFEVDPKQKGKKIPSPPPVPVPMPEMPDPLLPVKIQLIIAELLRELKDA